MKSILIAILITSNLLAQFTDYNCNKLKLKCDSKIYINNQNKKLVANSPIYGEFYLQKHLYKNGLLNTVCDKFERKYKIVNECKISIIGISNGLYTKKNRIKEIKKMDTDTHMLECKYDQKYGIMHDCDIKIYKYKLIK
jgi:hypothetical protein